MKETLKSTNPERTDVQLSDKKILASKLRGLTSHQQALIQKKLRIDLEIKKTQRKIRKLTRKTRQIVETFQSPYTEMALDPRKRLRFLQEATFEDRLILELLDEVRIADRMESDYLEIENQLYVPDL